MAKKYSKFKNLSLVLATSILTACADDSSSAASSCPTFDAAETTQQWQTNQLENSTIENVLVKLNTQTTLNDIRQALMAAHQNNADELGKITIQQVRSELLSIHIPVGSPARQTLSQLQRAHAVEYIEPNFPTYYAPLFDEDSVEAAEAQAQELADSAQDITNAGTREVIVAVIDSGVDYNHKDLAPYIWKNKREIPNNHRDDDQNGYIDDVRGWDFSNNDNDPMADDRGHYHGTHVAGIVKSAALLKAQGINLKIMPLKYLSAFGSGYSSNAIRALDYAIRNGATILNNSWGSPNKSQAMAEAVERTRRAHVLFIAASGNGDPYGNGINIDARPFYPAAYKHDNIISVAAADSGNRLTKWSNYGRVAVDLAAPGSQILSTMNGNTYARKSGTSMAAPYVAGVAASIWSLRPELSYREVRRIILSSVKTGSTFVNKTATSGALDRTKALSQAAQFAHDPNDERVADLTPAGCFL